MSNLETPRVSCLLPVFNGEKYLDEAIASILDQSLTDFELIVVDDGSTDSTASRLFDAARRDGRVRILQKANGGIVSALNAGLAQCRAAYVARMDADDVSTPDRFAFQADYLDRRSECVLVGGLARSEALQGRIVRQSTGGRYQKTDLSVFPPKIAVSVHPLIMVRRAALEAIGGYRDAYPHAEDYDLFIRLSRYGTIDNPAREVLFYRRHEGAVSVKNLVTQEVSAVRAECDAIGETGAKPVGEWLIEPYTRLRIFRRLQTIDIKEAGKHAARSVADLLSPSPRSLINRNYWRLRAVIAFTLMKFVIRRFAAS